MNTLTITNPDGAVLVSVQIGDIDPATATVAILSALAAIPKPRKPRADKGRARNTTATT